MNVQKEGRTGIVRKAVRTSGLQIFSPILLCQYLQKKEGQTLKRKDKES